MGSGPPALLRQLRRSGALVHGEVLEDSSGEAKAEVKLGVWLSNTKTRRATLTPAKLAVLAELGLHGG
ncbi:hypothetical protein [Streptomyces sp. 7N604]|uniref:hypothetical protein n=1 Tax=Streptomyces sp. 7N604 TaxID=3457415 RepID=UPI003FCFC890